MLVLGLILILLAAGSLVAVLASGTDDTAALYGGSVHLPTLVIFLLGAAALLLFIMGLELLRSGLKRANENRKKNRRLRTLEKREEGRDPDTGTATSTGSSDARSGTGGPTTRSPETGHGSAATPEGGSSGGAG